MVFVGDLIRKHWEVTHQAIQAFGLERNPKVRKRRETITGKPVPTDIAANKAGPRL